MLGQDVTYDRIPYFFSDQYDLGLEYSGWAPPGSYDEVIIRGDAGKREFIAFWLKDRRILAGMNVNVWDVTETVQELIRARQQHDAEALADPSVPLDSCSETRRRGAGGQGPHPARSPPRARLSEPTRRLHTWLAGSTTTT